MLRFSSSFLSLISKAKYCLVIFNNNCSSWTSAILTQWVVHLLRDLGSFISRLFLSRFLGPTIWLRTFASSSLILFYKTNPSTCAMWLFSIWSKKPFPSSTSVKRIDSRAERDGAASSLSMAMKPIVLNATSIMLDILLWLCRSYYRRVRIS